MLTLTQSRILEITDLAEAYADTFFPDSWIDPGQLVRRLGVSISYNYYGETFDGLLEWKRPLFHVYCNLSRVESSTSARARFTLGHEAGHLLIDEHRIAMMSGKAPSRHPSFADVAEPKLKVEAEADLFASNLLMPAARFERAVPRAGWTRTFEQILQVKNTFNVSFQSAALKVIGTADDAFCACIMWRKYKGPWYRVSKGFVKGGYVYMKRDEQNIPAHSATASCLKEGDVPLMRLPHSNAATASEWFHGVWQGSRQDILLKETAVHLGNHGVFTFLSWAPEAAEV